MSSRRLDITDVNQKVDLDRINPIGDFLLVKMVEKYESSGGIIIPKGERSAARFAKVLRIGWGTTNPVTGEVYPIPYKPGDYVCFMDYAGERIEIKAGKFRMIREHGIWAKVELDDKFNLTNVYPSNDVLVVDFPREEKSLSGIIDLPSNIQTVCRTGNVISVGPGRLNIKTGFVKPCEVKAGDRVIILRYSGANVYIGKKEYRLANETDIKAILEGEGDVDCNVTPPGLHAEDPVIREERQSREQLEGYADRGLISRDMIR